MTGERWLVGCFVCLCLCLSLLLLFGSLSVFCFFRSRFLFSFYSSLYLSAYFLFHSFIFIKLASDFLVGIEKKPTKQTNQPNKQTQQKLYTTILRWQRKCIHIHSRLHSFFVPFWMRLRFSITGRVRPSVRRSVGPSVRSLVPSYCQMTKTMVFRINSLKIA